MAGSVTLIEMAKGVDPATKAFIEIYSKTSDILNAMYFTSDGVAAGVYRYNIEGALPGIAFRGINEAYTPSAGILNPQVETLKVAGHEFRVDTAEVRWKGQGYRAKQVAMQMKSMAALVTDKLLRGDNTSDPREPDGLQRRLPLTGSRTISNTTASGGAAVKLSKLIEARDSTMSPTHWIMNRDMRRWLSLSQSDTSVSGYFTQTADSFGNVVTRFMGLPILVGYEVGPETQILPFTEANFGGGATTSTSIYCVNLSQDGLQMLQSQPPMAKDLGEMQSEPSWLTRAEWDISPVIENPYCVTRLSSITNAAMTRT